MKASNLLAVAYAVEKLRKRIDEIGIPENEAPDEINIMEWMVNEYKSALCYFRDCTDCDDV